ncbi:MAG: TraR/DksA C4-type zinc finger protein [Planctomycetes bacterium]|nr:TraR/DksA C4-type zinc finger protein [Planctomycetota bacterium]
MAKTAKKKKAVTAARTGKPAKAGAKKPKPVPAPKKPVAKPIPKPSAKAAVAAKPVKPAKPAPHREEKRVVIQPEEKPRWTKAEFAEIRAKLVAMLQDMKNDVETELSVAHTRDLAHIQDESDIASDSAESDLALSLAESQGAEVAEIERAIEKIDEGTYGVCDITGKPINIERLKFLPWATRSVEAQGRYELRRRRIKNGDLDDLEDADDTGGSDDDSR